MAFPTWPKVQLTVTVQAQTELFKTSWSSGAFLRVSCFLQSIINQAVSLQADEKQVQNVGAKVQNLNPKKGVPLRTAYNFCGILWIIY